MGISETAQKNHDELFPGHVSTAPPFAMLVALGGCDAQVRGHVAANLNVRNGRGLLISVITVLVPFIGYPRTLNALAAVNEIAPAAKEGQ